jgi:hypothetical protein
VISPTSLKANRTSIATASRMLRAAVIVLTAIVHTAGIVVVAVDVRAAAGVIVDVAVAADVPVVAGVIADAADLVAGDTNFFANGFVRIFTDQNKGHGASRGLFCLCLRSWCSPRVSTLLSTEVGRRPPDSRNGVYFA